MQEKLSIVVPCYNEALNLKKFYAKILEQISLIQASDLSAPPPYRIDYELIFVNDGSKDHTLQVLQELSVQDPKIKILDFSRNFGKESAILAGLKASCGDYIVLIDADLQDPIELIPEMYLKVSSNEADVVCVRRINRQGESRIRAALSKMFYSINQYVSDVKIQSGIRDFRLMSREVLDSILSLGEYHRFSKAIFEWVGFRKQTLEYRYISREKGESGWSFWKLFKYAIEGIVSFSTMPLRLSFVIGALASVLAMCYGGFIIIDTLIFGNAVRGYPSLVCIIVFFGGLQLIVLGIIGEYIARIYEQVKNRPHYILRRKDER